jgi:putative GTP pyrophosphokinase
MKEASEAAYALDQKMLRIQKEILSDSDNSRSNSVIPIE